jgi:hypothetical protein
MHNFLIAITKLLNSRFIKTWKVGPLRRENALTFAAYAFSGCG